MATLDEKDLIKGSDEVYQLVCLPCHRDDITIPAIGYCIDCHEHLCYNCYKHHKKATPCRHHKLQDKDTMPSTQQLTDTTVHAGPTDNLTLPCIQHQKEMIKLYCHDHDLLLCSICVALEHTKPCHVDYIPEISDKMINSQDYKDIMDRTDKLLKKCATIKTETSRDTNKSKDSLNDALLEIKKYRQDINKRIDELQKEIEAKINALQHQNDETIKSVETICEHVMKRVKVKYDNMKHLHICNQADQLFVEVKQAQKQLQEYERSINSILTEVSIEGYQFIPNQAINGVLQDEKMIGDISTKHQALAGFSSHSTTSDDITPTCVGEICVKTSEDRKRCIITGMTVLSPDRLVLADGNNLSIKLVDVNSKCITSRLSLGGEEEDTPWGITSTTSTQVAVTLPGSQCIHFISVSDKLNMDHTIKTDGYCSCVCCHQNKLIVTYVNPAKLDILDMKGRVIRRVETDSTGKSLFNKALIVQANSSYIYVNDTGSIIMLNWQGEITGRFEDLKGYTGLALLGDGSLLVCNKCTDRVYQVSDVCTNSRVVIGYVNRPAAACVDDRLHKLYISRYTNEKDQMDNNILVYNI